MKSKKSFSAAGLERQGVDGLKSTPQREPAKSKSQLQDDSIMGTNNSSIVSKRSVERLYFPNEPHFFQYFVKKPQRRSPLINRGYWLRMKAIDEVVKNFLEQKSKKKKIVINLGCGYDPLPWQCFSCCSNTTFVDVDYRDLMLRKRAVVQTTPELNTMLSNIEISEGDVLFKSNEYIQLGCDLRNLAALKNMIWETIDIENCAVLFVAEVSIAYMDIEAADELIEWASTLPDARFCLLEQILPDGIDHPFAQTMMAYFDKLGTPINAAQKYPTTAAQQSRFSELGWDYVEIQNLWQLWSSPDFLSPMERKALDQVEPFDEWEEFALYGCHYFLLVASTKTSSLSSYFKAPEQYDDRKPASTEKDTEPKFDVDYMPYPKGQGRRRFAAAMPLPGSDESPRFGIFGGVGIVSRTNSYDEYVSDRTSPLRSKGPSVSPSSRMCHTITDLGGTGALLVGGRTSPDNGLKDCWLYHTWSEVWERVGDLPHPLFRHQAVRIDDDHVLVSTGRIDSKNLSSKFLLWIRLHGWVQCDFKGDTPCPTYGQVLFAWTKRDSRDQNHGIICGGITEYGVIQSKTWHWALILDGYHRNRKPVLEVKESSSLSSDLATRFGAEAINWYDGCILIVGGIAKDRLLSAGEEMCAMKDTGSVQTISRVKLQSSEIPRSLVLGSSAVVVDNQLIITGGSCVCFSFGSWWNEGSLTLTPASNKDRILSERASSTGVWRFSRTIEAQASVIAKPEIDLIIALGP